MSMSGDKIYKPKPVSGFPEWLPEVRLVEQQWLHHIRRVFESYGFCSIETPSVEELDVIAAKGEVDKEIYVLERLHADPADKKEARLALHFDQTVPLARYVAQHFNGLVFPFKRYQMQRVWRGERPQAGRFREFTQCDIDVINVDNLPLHFDAEMPAIIWEVLSSLPGMENEKIQLRISNRKIMYGYLQALGINAPDLITNIIRAADKLEKIGREEALRQIMDYVKDAKFEVTYHTDLNKQIGLFLAVASYRYKNAMELVVGTDEPLSGLGTLTKLHPELKNNELFKQGMTELTFVMDQLSHLPQNTVVADLSIVRGLDYYTGTVYETVFVDDPGYGSICSGGRYDDLASSYINKKLPGVGISIGFSRLFARLHEQGKLPVKSKSPADILMVLPSEERRALAAQTAATLRKRGFNVEMYHAPKKTGDQIKFADRKGIPYVWFPPFEDGKDHEVKCMGSGTQQKADPAEWNLDEKK